jgi:phage-related protein
VKVSSEPRKKFRQVEFFKKDDGTKPVGDWLHAVRAIDKDRAQSIAIGIRYFEEYPGAVVPTKIFEKVTDNIWEIKVHHGKEQFRLLSFPDGNSVIIAVHGLAKKTRALVDQDLRLAERRRTEYLARRKRKPG